MKLFHRMPVGQRALSSAEIQRRDEVIWRCFHAGLPQDVAVQELGLSQPVVSNRWRQIGGGWRWPTRGASRRAQDAVIWRGHQAGLSQTAVAQELRLSRAGVSRRWKKLSMGIPWGTGPAGAAAVASRDKLIHQAFAEGQTQASIARDLGISYQAVGQRWKRIGGGVPWQTSRGQRAAHAKRLLTGLAEITEDGVLFATNVPVAFRYARNTQPSPKPGPGDPFQQHIEPAGIYVGPNPSSGSEALPNVEVGIMHFTAPLVLIQVYPASGSYRGPENWKTRLSAAFGGKKGVALSKAILAEGYDGIVTVAVGRTSYVSETVDLRPAAGWVTRRGRRGPVLPVKDLR